MELLSALATGWITLLFLALSWVVKGRLDRLESRMEEGFRDLRSEMGSLRSDVTQIAIALGARGRPDTG